MENSAIESVAEISLSPLTNRLPFVQQALSKYFSTQEGMKLRDLQILQVISRPFSQVIFLNAQTSKYSQILVMKTIVHHPINKSITERQNQALVEYNILQNLYPKFQKVNGCSVPKPILVLPEIETYIMEFVEGNLLVDLFPYVRYFSSWRKFQTLKRYYYLCGRWLKYFQEFTGIRFAGPESLKGVIERCKQRLQLIEKARDPRCPKDLGEQVSRLINTCLKQLKGTKIPVSGRHGDFGPWNIICGYQKVTVIDFLGYCTEPVTVDLFKILLYLEEQKKCITLNPRRVEALKKSFLEGFGTLPQVPEPLLIICECMQRVVSLWGIISYPHVNIRYRIEANLRLKDHLNWLFMPKKKTLL